MSSVGLFHTIYHSPSIPGGVSLTLNLLVNTPAKKITGQAHLFQATNPPLNETYEVFGDYTVLNIMIMGAPQPLYIISLTGHAPGSTTPTFYLNGTFQDTWQHGWVSYRYLVDGEWHHQTQTIQAEESPSLQPHQHFIPLYAAALQQASATGSLLELKQLAATAQAQLNQSDDIHQALTKLNAHIAEREASSVPAMPYGVAVQQAISSGNLSQLKQLAQQIEQQISQSSILGPALAELKQHISKLTK